MSLISMWIPKHATLIREWHLFEAQHLLEEIGYCYNPANVSIEIVTHSFSDLSSALSNTQFENMEFTAEDSYTQIGPQSIL